MANVFEASGAHCVLSTGVQLNHVYEIDALIAIGGMGEVYRGHELQTGVPVAIKIIRADMANDDSILALFRKEASALSRINNEVVVRYFVFSLDPELRRHYLAMEFVEGYSLSDLLRSGPLEVEQVHLLKTRLASGLQAAHDNDVIHRDVSPDNVIVPGGDVARARIIDFGIARSTRVGDTTVIGGGFAGKYNYVSPEQLGLFEGQVTNRSDIYSLGLVLAQCLLATPIDMGGSQVEIVNKRRHVPNLEQIDGRIRPLLEKMLQPDPKDRPESMKNIMSWPLGRALADGTVIAPRASPAGRSPPPDGREAGSSRANIDYRLSAFSSAPALYEGKRDRTWRSAVIIVVGLAALGLSAFFAYRLLGNGKNPLERATDSATLSASPRSEPTQASNDTTASPHLGAEELNQLRFIREFEAGECVLLRPTLDNGRTVDIDAYGLNRKAFDVFDAAFKRTIGFEAHLDLNIVTEAQCPALAFVKQFQVAPASAMTLEIANSSLRSGEPLQGWIKASTAGVILLIVDDQGVVNNASRAIRTGAERSEFSILIKRTELSAPSHSALLVAIGAARPIDGLDLNRKRFAKELFPALISELSREGEAPTVALKYFRTE